MKTTPSHLNQPTIESLQAQVEEFKEKVRWYEEQFRLSQQNNKFLPWSMDLSSSCRVPKKSGANKKITPKYTIKFDFGVT